MGQGIQQHAGPDRKRLGEKAHTALLSRSNSRRHRRRRTKSPAWPAEPRRRLQDNCRSCSPTLNACHPAASKVELQGKPEFPAP